MAEKISKLWRQTDRQTDRQTHRQTMACVSICLRGHGGATRRHELATRWRRRRRFVLVG